jgi:DNA polymerase (family 10)
LRAAAPAALLELTKVPGVTTRRARLLHEALGVASVDELEDAARAGRVREVKGFGAKTEAAILAALASYRLRPVALRLVDAREMAAALAAFAAGYPGVEAVDVVGAVRRWEEVVDEVAIVGVTTRPPRGVLDAIAAYPPLARTEERAEDRFTARLATGVRVRVRLVSPRMRGRALIRIERVR